MHTTKPLTGGLRAPHNDLLLQNRRGVRRVQQRTHQPAAEQRVQPLVAARELGALGPRRPLGGRGGGRLRCAVAEIAPVDLARPPLCKPGPGWV